MEPKFITFDGIELLSSARVYFCHKTGKSPRNTKAICNIAFVHEIKPTDFVDFYFFSTKKLCRNYIDKMNTPVVFTTQDGVDMRVGDTYWVVFQSGIEPNGIKDTPSSSIVTPEFDIEKDFTLVYEILRFSTEAKAQEYLDSLNKPVVFTTSDDVNMYEGDKYWHVYKNDPNSSLSSGHAFSFRGSNYYTSDVLRVYFSTREKAQEYINSLKPVEPTVELKTVVQIGIDCVGKPFYENDILYCCWENCPINAPHDIIEVGVNKYTNLNPKFFYFTQKEACEAYIANQMIQRFKHTNETVEPVKSELKIAHDKLTALCAKYRNDNAVSQINIRSYFPGHAKEYSIMLFDGFGQLVHETAFYSLLEEAVVTAHSWLICNAHY